MPEPKPTVPYQLNSSHGPFAFGGQGYGKTFVALLTMSTIFRAIVAVMRGPVLMHWDDAATYAVLGHSVILLA